MASGHFTLSAPECEASPTGGRQDGDGHVCPAPLRTPIGKSETAAEVCSHSQDALEEFWRLAKAGEGSKGGDLVQNRQRMAHQQSP